MDLEHFIRRALESASAGFTTATLDRALTSVHQGTVRNPRAAKHAVLRCAVRAGALGVTFFALRERPDSLAAVSGALGYATAADFATLLFDPAGSAR
jgi:hypothetical protein